MTKADFIALVAEEIETAVMCAQGIGGGFIYDESPDDRAHHTPEKNP